MDSKDLELLGYREDDENEVFEGLIKDLVVKNIADRQKKEQLYAALCNVIWYQPIEKIMYSCSWRSAGALIAQSEGVVRVEKHKILGDWNTDYLEYYCSGSEGHVELWIELELAKNNWFPADWKLEKRSWENMTC